MTCIVGIEHEGMVYIGGDSAASNDWCQVSSEDAKVFQKGEFVFGFTTSFRMGQILKYSFNPPEQMCGQNTMEFMVTNFIDSLRNTFKEAGFAQKDREQESGGTFMVGYKGKIYTIQEEYLVLKTNQKYNAVGSGSVVALGALYATKGMPPGKRIQVALEAASEHNSFVRPPYTIIGI